MKQRIYQLFLPFLLFSSLFINATESSRSKKSYWILIKEQFNIDRFKIKLKHTLKINEIRQILQGGSRKIDTFFKKHTITPNHIITGIAASMFSLWIYALSKMDPETRREALLMPALEPTIYFYDDWDDIKNRTIGRFLFLVFVSLPLEMIFSLRDHYYAH